MSLEMVLCNCLYIILLDLLTMEQRSADLQNLYYFFKKNLVMGTGNLLASVDSWIFFLKYLNDVKIFELNETQSPSTQNPFLESLSLLSALSFKMGKNFIGSKKFLLSYHKSSRKRKQFLLTLAP